MSVDEDFEALLRREFLDQEPQVSTAPDLPGRLVADGILAVRRRRALLGIGTAVGAASLVAGVAIAVNLASSPGAIPDPAANPSADVSASELSLTLWAESLPRGESPEVAYLAGTTVHLPSGAVADLGVADAEMVGQTVAGLIVHVEDANDRGVLTGTRFVMVGDDGSTREMETSTVVPGISLSSEPLVSPDGRYFTNGGAVIDKATGLAVDQVPEEARALFGWTSQGIVYSRPGQQYFLWRLGEEPIPLAGFPGLYPSGTDIGLRHSDNDCAEVVRMDRAGHVTSLSAGCIPGLLSVSPDGARGITTDLNVVDVESGEISGLSEAPLSDIYPFTDVRWLDDEQALFSVPAAPRKGDAAGDGRARLLRCDASELTCQSVTESLNVGDNGFVQLP